MSSKESEGTPCSTRIKGCVFLSIFVVAAVVAMSITFTGSANPVDYWVPVDPPGAKEAVRWGATEGLTLVVEDATDDTYTAHFDQSVLDWNETEALTLIPRKVAYDKDCSPAFGRLKVCNGDYGNTNWRGINTIVLNMDVVSYSVAKLNDYHLLTEHDKLYTTCHEIGHGFGLPHTDENHLNRDRGDCMDYTNRPWNNLVPGEFNLELLERLYGTPGNPAVQEGEEQEQVDTPPPAPTRPTPPRPPRDEEEDEKEDKKEKDDRKRGLRGLQDSPILDLFGDSETGEVPLWCQEAASQEADKCEASYCSLELGEGYRVEIYKLMV